MPRVAIALLSLLAIAAEWNRLPDLPEPVGVAGSFIGVSHGALIVAGGANFPKKRPWEGGEKNWHSPIYVLESPRGPWIKTSLLMDVCYGVSVTHKNKLICVGGCNGSRYSEEVLTLEWKSGQLIVGQLPSLPTKLANACGAMIDDEHLVVAGGHSATDGLPSKALYLLNVQARSPRWQRLKDLPGEGRILAIGVGLNRAFYVVGGVTYQQTPADRQYLQDAYHYDLGQGWAKLKQLPTPLAAAMVISDERGFTILGGDDGTQWKDPLPTHRGFRKQQINFRLKDATWHQGEELPFARVTTPAVFWQKSWVVVSGEVRPGVRSPEVWRREP